MKKVLLLVVIGSLMGAPAAAAGAEETSTGASVAWTSTDPHVVAVREHLDRGEFAEAQQKLAGQTSQPAVEMRDLVVRLRREYGQSEAALLKKLRESIPDVTAADLVRWREAGEVQYRTIDGKVAYFRREPSNIFRFCEDAKARRAAHAARTAPDHAPQSAPAETAAADKAAADKGAADKGAAVTGAAKRGPSQPAPAAAATSPSWKLADHLARVVAEAEKTGGVEVVPVTHRVTFTATIPPGAGGAKAGSVARVWLPFPQEYRQQKNVTLFSSEPAPTRVADNGVPHRTLYYERTIEDPKKPLVITAVFGYVSSAYYPALSDDAAKALPAGWAERAGNGRYLNGQYLAERAPHVAFTPALRAKVKEVVGDEPNPLARARKIFYWIAANVRYHAEEEYCLIPSLSTKALASLKGDCGMQGILFVTMCRAAGVPARWQSGWETKPVDWNMHDWAEFYVEPWGWLPADPSYGLQKSDDPAVRAFYFGHQDSYRLIVNTDYGRPLTPAKTSFRSEPADFQRGEAEIDGKNLYFDEWDYDFRFEQQGVEPASPPRP